MLKSCADISDDLDSGCLERILPEWQSEPAPIYALTLSGRHRSTKIRVFLEAAKARLERVGKSSA